MLHALRDSPSTVAAETSLPLHFCKFYQQPHTEGETCVRSLALFTKRSSSWRMPFGYVLKVFHGLNEFTTRLYRKEATGTGEHFFL